MVPNWVPWDPFWDPFLRPHGVLMSFYCPNLFIWAHLPPILVIKSLKESTFKKWSQIWSHGTTFGTPPGTPRGLNVLLLSQFIHLGSFATHFGHKIIKNLNFQKWSQIWSHGTPFGTPPGTPRGPKFFWWVVYIQLHPLQPKSGEKHGQKAVF